MGRDRAFEAGDWGYVFPRSLKYWNNREMSSEEKEYINGQWEHMNRLIGHGEPYIEITRWVDLGNGRSRRFMEAFNRKGRRIPWRPGPPKIEYSN